MWGQDYPFTESKQPCWLCSSSFPFYIGRLVQLWRRRPTQRKERTERFQDTADKANRVKESDIARGEDTAKEVDMEDVASNNPY